MVPKHTHTLSLEKVSEVGTANYCCFCFFLINVLFYLTGLEGIFNEVIFLVSLIQKSVIVQVEIINQFYDYHYFNILSANI